MHHTGGEPTDDRDPEQHQDHPARARPAAAPRQARGRRRRPRRRRLGGGPSGLEPCSRPAARRGGHPRVRRGRGGRRCVCTHRRASRCSAGHRPQRRGARRPRGHDPAQDPPDARRHDRPGRPHCPRRGRRDLDRGRRGCGRARPRSARRLITGCRRRRLHARRRPLVARPQARHRRQPGDGDRGRHRVGRPRANGLGERARPVLGASRRRRLVRDRHRDRVQPVPDHRGLRRHPLVPRRGGRRGAEGVAQLDGGPARTR